MRVGEAVAARRGEGGLPRLEGSQVEGRSVAGEQRAAPQRRGPQRAGEACGARPQTGTTPRLRQGRSTRLPSQRSSARATTSRVRRGSITSSIMARIAGT